MKEAKLLLDDARTFYELTIAYFTANPLA